MKLTANSFRGRWKIVWMEIWDQDVVGAEVPGHVTLADKGREDFQFGYVYGSFARSAKNDRIEAQWEGNDEMDPAHGDIQWESKEESSAAPLGYSMVTDRLFVRYGRTNRRYSIFLSPISDGIFGLLQDLIHGSVSGAPFKPIRLHPVLV
jgi:hypothetical protein